MFQTSEIQQLLPMALSLSPERAAGFLAEVRRRLGNGPGGEAAAYRVACELLRVYATPPPIKRAPRWHPDRPLLYRYCRRCA
jgi:hypothetical protein